MASFLFTFLLATAFYAFLTWAALRRLAAHLQGNDEAAKALAQHVLVPMFGEKAANAIMPSEPERKPEEPGKGVF